MRTKSYSIKILSNVPKRSHQVQGHVVRTMSQAGQDEDRLQGNTRSFHLEDTVDDWVHREGQGKVAEEGAGSSSCMVCRTWEEASDDAFPGLQRMMTRGHSCRQTGGPLRWREWVHLQHAVSIRV